VIGYEKKGSGNLERRHKFPGLSLLRIIKMKRKVCKKCKMFVEGNSCLACKENQFSNNWQGRLAVIDANKSLIAKKIGITVKGEYAIKVR